MKWEDRITRLKKFEQVETTLVRLSTLYIPDGLLEKTGILQAIKNIQALKEYDKWQTKLLLFLYLKLKNHQETNK